MKVLRVLGLVFGILLLLVGGGLLAGSAIAERGQSAVQQQMENQGLKGPVDGTVVHELIYHDAGAKTPEGLKVTQLHRLIREAGREPVERDTLYRRVIRDGKQWTIGGPIT